MKHRLAVAYDIECFSPIEIVTAIGEDCDVIWIVDSSRPLGPMGPLLPRTGRVVDLAGSSSESAIAAVSEARPEGIVAFSDTQLPAAAAIAAGLGLRFNSPSVTRLFVDKYEQRAALRASGVVVPEFVAIPSDASDALILSLAAPLTFPAVLKPRSGSSSRDTYLVVDAGDLVRVLATIRPERRAEIKEFVLEEYLPGVGVLARQSFADFVSVESVVTGGRVRHLAVTGKFPLAEPFRESGNFMPCLLSSEDAASVIALAESTACALGAQYGCLHTEIKLTPAGPRVIESNARVGGGGIEDLFVASYGESLLRVAAMTALGLEPPPRVRLRPGAVAFQLFVMPPFSARRLDRLEGLDQISALAGISQLRVNLRAGDETDWRRGSGEYTAAIRGSVSDHAALQSIRGQIHERLVVEYS